MYEKEAPYPHDLENWQKLYPADKGGANDADRLLRKAIDDFAAFAKEYRNYFDERTGAITAGGKMTADSLQTRVEGTLDAYWAPIARVAEQRQVEHYRALLDQGAEAAQQTLDKIGRSVPGVLVYFDRISAIRRCPYTDIAFVGIPFQAACANDWHAISHEIGHYVYWNFIPATPLARIKGNPEHSSEHPIKVAARKFLDENLADVAQKKRVLVRDLLLAWLEETFADVFGARLDGEASITSLQRRIVREVGNADGLSATDGRHPPPYLRLFIRELAVRGNHHVKTLREGRNGKPEARTNLFFQERFALGQDNTPQIKAYRELSTFSDRTRLATLRQQVEPIMVPAADLQAGLKKLVPMLGEQIDTLLRDDNVAQRKVRGSAFERLRAQADLVDEAEQDVDTVLLNPRILEGAHDSSGGHTGPVMVIGGGHLFPTSHDPWPHDH